MSIVTIKNFVHVKPASLVNKTIRKNQVDRRTFESCSHETLAGECNHLVAMLA
jgi:hypothetical protein